MGTIRVLLALSVVFAHSAWNGGSIFVNGVQEHGGRNAVQLFYVISGFLISFVLVEARAYRSVKSFYVNRWLRLYPIYGAVLVLTGIAFIVANRKFFVGVLDMPLAALVSTMLVNVTLLGQDWIMFLGIQGGHLMFMVDPGQSEVRLPNGLMVPQAWTLGVEMTFYAVAPFILFRRWLVVSLLLGSVLARLWAIHAGFGVHDPWTYRFFPFELALFLAGALSHQVVRPWWQRILANRGDAGVRRAVIVGTGVMLAVSALYSLLPIDQVWGSIALYAMYVALLPLAFEFQSMSSLDKKIGDLSYPIYVGHILVVMVVNFGSKYLRINDPLVMVLMNVACSLLFAVVLNVAIGDRIEGIRRRIKERKRIEASVS
jgi:peptidoglycan/LPS O-acetylase OafA/YrhL